MRPFLIAESVRQLRTPYPAAKRVLEVAAGGRLARTAFVQLWMTDGIPYAFRDCPAVYASMRAWLGRRLGVHAKAISLTGSGRFGESWVPRKLGRAFGPESDLDLFLVSLSFFDRVQEEFRRWRDEYVRGEVLPRNEAEERYWDEHRTRGPEVLGRGFLDTRMIPTWRRYETSQDVAQAMWILKRRLEATPNAPRTKGASIRVYRDFSSLVAQESLNLYHATKSRAGALLSKEVPFTGDP